MKKKNAVYSICPNCKMSNPNKSTICSNCRADLRKGKNKKKNEHPRPRKIKKNNQERLRKIKDKKSRKFTMRREVL